MSVASKIITLLILGALLGLVVRNAGNSAKLMQTGGNVLDNTLSIESGGSWTNK